MTGEETSSNSKRKDRTGPSVEERLYQAMEAALTQYETTTGSTFPSVPRLETSPSLEFWATADIKREELVITVSLGLLETVVSFWIAARKQHEMPGTVDDMIQNSLTWLLAHEFLHYDLGHFEITERLSLSEVKNANMFGLASRMSEAPPKQLKGIALEDLPKIEPCLELQADAEASEMVLDAYSPDGWQTIRARTAVISGMMMLIQREDAKRGYGLSSHPKAATRIFQLIGHVMEMPTILPTRAHQHPELGIDPTIPSDAEQSAYNRQVSIPAFLDAVALARLAGAEMIQNDLGQPAEFFGDIQIAKLGAPNGFDSIKTPAGLQWAELEELNGQLLEI